MHLSWTWYIIKIENYKMQNNNELKYANFQKQISVFERLIQLMWILAYELHNGITFQTKILALCSIIICFNKKIL